MTAEVDADGLCVCEFEPDDYLYKRICQHCGTEWFGLHCPHDGAQNPCPECGVRPTPLPDHVKETTPNDRK